MQVMQVACGSAHTLVVTIADPLAYGHYYCCITTALLQHDYGITINAALLLHYYCITVIRCNPAVIVMQQ